MYSVDTPPAKYETEEEVKEIVNSLSSASSLLSVSLANNSYNDVAFGAIGAALALHTQLKTLDLTYCFAMQKPDVVSKALTSLFPSVSPTLETLLLSDNAVGRSCSEALFSSLQRLVNIKELDLTNCGLNTEDAPRLAQWLETTKIESLRLGRNRLEDGFPSVAAALARMGTLRVLSINNCGISGPAMAETLKLLSSSDVREFEVKDNTLCGAGKELLDAVSAWNALENLDLSCTLVEEESVSALLPHLNSLKVLSLEHNGLPSRLCASLCLLPNLKLVKLNGNGLREKSVLYNEIEGRLTQNGCVISPITFDCYSNEESSESVVEATLERAREEAADKGVVEATLERRRDEEMVVCMEEEASSAEEVVKAVESVAEESVAQEAATQEAVAQESVAQESTTQQPPKDELKTETEKRYEEQKRISELAEEVKKGPIVSKKEISSTVRELIKKFEGMLRGNK